MNKMYPALNPGVKVVVPYLLFDSGYFYFMQERETKKPESTF